MGHSGGLAYGLGLSGWAVLEWSDMTVRGRSRYNVGWCV